MTALFDIEHIYRLRFLIHIHLGGFIFHFYHNAWWWWFMLAFTETLVIEMWTGFLCIFMSWWCLMLYVKVQYQKLMCKDRIISLWMSWFFWLLDNVWRYWPIWWGISLVSRKFLSWKLQLWLTPWLHLLTDTTKQVSISIFFNISVIRMFI